MKYYYLEHDLYPAKFNFRNEAVGTSGTDIDFVNTTDADLAEIISSYKGHKKVLKVTDIGTSYLYNFSFLAGHATGTVEFYGFVVIGNVYYRIRASTNEWCIQIRIYDSGVIRIYHAATYTNHNITTDFPHIKAQWDCTTDKQSIWVDEILVVDDQPFMNSVNVDTLNRFNVSTSVTCEYYLDAIGFSWDANYNVGDNKEVKWHKYNKEQITDVIQEPIIAPRLDAYWIGSFAVRDFEGSLFSSWNDRDFNKILIEDDSSNVLFRGFLIKKVFTTNSLVFTIAGIGILLDWQPFGSDGYVNYVLAEGLVKAPINANSILNVKDDEGADFTWANDYWIKEGRDLGVLIVEGGAVSTKDWDSSVITQTTGSVISGNNASTLTFMDSDSYRARDESSPNLENKITLAINGDAVDDTDYLKSIEIQYNFRLRLWAQYLEANYASVSLQIKKKTGTYSFRWDTIAKASIEENLLGGLHVGGWVTGVPTDVDGGNGNQFVIKGTDSELQKYFNKTGATYSMLAGLRFKLSGVIANGSYVDVDIDFIKIKVGYKGDDISPMMAQITDSAASTLTCSSVSAWDETGVNVDDSFKIGQNTRVILQDVASQSGLDIFFETPTRVHTLRPDQDGAINDWTLSGYERVDEVTPDAYIIFANLSDSGEYEEFGFPNDIVFPSSDIVTEVKVYTYAKMVGTNVGFRVDVYYNGEWQGLQVCTHGAGYSWETHTFTISGGTVVPDDLKVRYRSYTASEDAEVSVNTCYVKVTVEYAYAFERYTARKYIGAYCMEPLRSVVKLEGAHWFEDYINDRIVVLKHGAFLDSGVDLTEADYGHAWTFEDDCNQVRSFYVFGNAENEVFAKAIDESVSGYLSKQIVDETISNNTDAQEIADVQLALLNSKRPSIRLPLDGVRANLQLGKTVDVTLVRPTVAKTNYIIRKIERSSRGISGIKTVIYCGLGESPIDEKIGNIIRDNAFRSHKALTDRLISP